MNDPSFVPPPPEPEKPRAPILGTLSWVAALLSILLYCGMFVLTYVVGGPTEFDSARLGHEKMTSLGYGLLTLLSGSGFAALVAVILGIITVSRKGGNKVPGIWGLTLSGFTILGYCFLLAWRLFSG